MGKSIYSFALDDELFKALSDFTKNGNVSDQKLIKTLLSYRINGEVFIFNIDQAKRCGVQLDSSLESQLRHKKLNSQSLEDLAKETLYKGVLSINNDKFPYINIYNGKIKPTISGTYYKNESRDNAIAHIKALCEKAKKITILDKYLTSTTDSINVLADNILPRKSIDVVLHDKSIERGYDPKIAKSKLSQKYNAWKIDLQNLSVYSHHDRYILIDDEIEVIISSGLDNLSSTDKDVTYIVKCAHPVI